MVRPKIIFEDGKPSEVILRIDDYEQMLEQLEQIDDLNAIRSMSREDRATIPFDEFLREGNGDVYK